MEEPLETLVRTVLASPKYRAVSPALVRRVGARELAVRPNLKAAVKATKNVLHQIGGAFIDKPIDTDRALALLREASMPGKGKADWRAACRQIMTGHTSTRERLPILDHFYATTLADIPRPRVILDLACGLNPLARPWMPFDRDATYYAYDIYSDLIAFLQASFDLGGFAGQAEVRDIVHEPPAATADLALILKSLPCLEALDRQAPSRLLEAVPARYLLVSFPAHSLGGRRKGMVGHYEDRFRQLIAERGWPAERFEFDAELAFLVQKT